jgi:hypothetical protein
MNGQYDYDDDLLGLVAKKSVRVSASAPNDLTIQATVMAVEGAFKVDNYWVQPPKGTLHVYGGIIAKYGGYTGVFSPSSGLTAGYMEQHGYDQRLLNIAPPFYPTTGRYEGVWWRE